MDYLLNIKLDLNLDREMPVARVKQGDASARKLTIFLEKDGETFIPESGVQFLFRCEKPDGHAVILDSEYQDETLGRTPVVNNGDGTVTVELTGQVTVVPGVCRCDICMYKGEQILSTVPFAIDVKRSPNITSLVVSSDDFRTMSMAIQQARNLMRGVAQCSAVIYLSDNWNGVESPYYQNVTVTGYPISPNTKVDLIADPTVVDSMLESKTNQLMAINNGGVLTVYATGNAPTEPLTVQACLYETIPVEEWADAGLPESGDDTGDSTGG